MSKVSTFLSNIFHHRRRSLEVDAVTVSSSNTMQQNSQDNDDNGVLNSFTTSLSSVVNDVRISNDNNEDVDEFIISNNNINSKTSSCDNNLDSITTVPSINYTNSSESLSLVANSTNNISNPFDSSVSNVQSTNALPVNNTQGHIVYQFSNIERLHIGHVINVQNNTNTNSIQNKNKYQSSSSCKQQQLKPKTRTILKMMESKELLDHKMINVISTHLGKGWKDIMRTLNYSEGQIDTAYIDYNVIGLKEVIYQLVLEWNQNDNSANLGKVTRILWKAGHRDIVYFMKDLWKESIINDINDNSSKNSNESEI